MILPKEFSDELQKLDGVKDRPKMKDFFDTVEMLIKMNADISKYREKKSAAASKLQRQARSMADKLEENKEKIASYTKTQIEYDAVYYCIDCLGKVF